MRPVFEFLKNAGVDEIIGNTPQKLCDSADEQTPQQTEKATKEAPIDMAIYSDLEKISSLAELEEFTKNFDKCDLKKLAKSTVFSDGANKSGVMFIGEAPGATEDEKGIPFCGQSGKLLTNIIASLGFSRDDSYITNTVFWRPPGNRRPTPAEINTCRPIVEKHVALVAPKRIILVGSTAVESLLGKAENATMHDLREKTFQYTNKFLENPIPTTVIFHPSYLLRQQQKKKLMWEDMIKLKKQLAA